MLADVAEEMKGLSMRTFDDYGVHWRNFSFFNPVTIPLSPICIEKTVVTVVLPLEKTVSWAVFSK